MFAEQQREYLDKGYTKIESFFSAEEVAKILEDVKQIELGAIGVASDNETYQFEKKNGETTKLLRRVENPHLYFDAIDSLVRSEKSSICFGISWAKTSVCTIAKSTSSRHQARQSSGIRTGHSIPTQTMIFLTLGIFPRRDK